MANVIGGKTTVLFDMFNTLAEPHEAVKHFEYEPLGATAEQWHDAFWEPALVLERGLGRIRSPWEIFKRACGNLPFAVTDEQIEASLNAHLNRMRLALCDVDEEILSTLRELKRRGYRLGIISDADVTDIAYWKDSPLRPLMDTVVFSCDAGLKKPDAAIFSMALKGCFSTADKTVFVGDGGSDELHGAKRAGMTTIRSEYLLKRSDAERAKLDADSDYVISRFSELKTLLPELHGM